jgi:hypothetical protein
MNASDEVREKVARLLSTQVPLAPHFSERCLSALLLISRSTQPIDDIFQQHDWLVRWIEALIEQNESSQDLRELYIRLAAQLLGRISEKSGDTDKQLALVLLHQLDSRLSLSVPISAVDVDLVSNVAIWMERTNDAALLDSAMNSIWKRWSEGHTRKGSSSSSSSSLNDNPADEDLTPPLMMAKVLDQVLSESSMVDSDESLTIVWDDEVMRVLRCNLHRLSQPTCFTRILHWWLFDKLREGDLHRFSLAAILLHSLSVIMNSNKQSSFLRSKSVELSQLIQACIISTHARSDTLRGYAWTCLVRLVELLGWDWLFLETNTWTRNLSDNEMMKGALGSAAVFCAFLRLASGEFKIQLGRVAEETNASRTCLDILNGTSQFVAIVLDYMTKLVDSDSLTLNSSAVVHIRLSLREALDSCVQFICLDSTNTHPIEVELMVVRLYSTLLIEFLNFDGEDLEQTDEVPLNSMEEQRQQPIQVFPAMRQALTFREPALQQSTLSALVTVFASCEGDVFRIQCIQRYELLGQSLVSFLKSFFAHRSNTEGVDLAAQVTELWYEISMETTDTAIEVSGLQDSICDWIESIMQSPSTLKQTEEEVAIALGSAVGCYVTLQGDTRPNEPQASTIERALKFCAIIESETGFV